MLNSEPNHHRPWQGTALGAFSTTAFSALTLGMLGSLTWIIHLKTSASPLQANGIELLFLGLIALTLTLIPFSVLQYFASKGIFKGRQWSLIYSLAATLMLFPTLLVSPLLIWQKLIKFPILFNTFLSALMIFLLYLEIMCLKHPYYRA